MIRIFINNTEFFIKKDISILEACKYVGINIPRFCYHEILSVAGNCRMCLVEVLNSPKPVASCVSIAFNDIKIFVNTPLVKKARESLIERLLLNHPLDCPICDQAGECDLQDQTKLYGSDHNRIFFKKKAVEDKYCGPVIKTIMTRCIQCTRCVRYSKEIAGVDFFGTLNRGVNTEIGNYLNKTFLNSEISGNVIDLCPVGALTLRSYAFKVRPWELRSVSSIDFFDSFGSNIYINYKESNIYRILPRINSKLNGNLITDKARIGFDFNNFNRLLYINSFLKNINWKNSLDMFKSSFKQDKNKSLFIINEEIDLFSLNILKNISYNNTNIEIRTISNSKNQNIYVNWLLNKFSELKKKSNTCIILSSNIKIESGIFNNKLRYKKLNENLNFYCFSYFNNNDDNSLNFINFKINKI